MRFTLLLALPLALLSACGGGGGSGNVTAPANSIPAVPAPAGKEWREVVVRTDAGMRMGNPDARLKLVEYGSRGCPVCGALANAGMETLITQYVNTGRVSYEYREFWVHGPSDVAASLIGTCVDDAAFFPILEAMYQAQPELNGRIQTLSPAQLQQLGALPQTQAPTAWAEAAGYLEFIKQHGVPEAKARQCLGDQTKLKALAELNAKAANDRGVSGTPTFFLNDSQLEGVSTWPALQAALRNAGA